MYLENITILQSHAGQREMNLVPHLEQVSNQGPWLGARERRIFHVVRLEAVVVVLSAPEGHQKKGQETQGNSDT